MQDRRYQKGILGIIPRRVAASDTVHGRPDTGQRCLHHRRGGARGHRAGAVHAGHRTVARQRPGAAGDRVHQYIHVCCRKSLR